MKLLKRIALVLLALVLLLGIGAYVLVLIYKNDLSEKILTTLRERYGAIAEVEKVKVSLWDNWPHASVEFENISLRSELAPAGSPDLLKAKRLSLAFNLRQLTQGKVILKQASIIEAEFYLKRNLNDSSNFLFKSPAPDSTANGAQNIDFDLKQVQIKKSHFTFENLHSGQHFAFRLINEQIKLQHFVDGSSAQISGELFSERMELSTRKGSFVEQMPVELALKVIWRKDLNTILVYPGSELRIQQEKYPLVVLYKYRNEKQLALLLSANNSDFQKTRRLLTPRLREILANFEVKDKINGKALIVAYPGQYLEPYLNISFEGKNHTLAIGNTKVPYTNLNFSGQLLSCDSTKTYGDLEHASLRIFPVSGKVRGLPFTGKVQVTNLLEPYVRIDGSLDVNAATVDFKVARDFVLQGHMYASVKYEGPASKLNSNEFLDAPMKLRASLRFSNLSYREFNKRYAYVVNGRASFNNRDLQFDSLRLKTVVGNAKLSGKAQNFVPYLLGYASGFKARISATSELIDLNPLFEKPTKQAPVSKRAEKSTVDKLNDAELSHFDFSIQLATKKMLIRKVIAEAVAAEVVYKNSFVQVKSLSANACGGKLNAAVDIKDFTKISARITANSMNVVTMFNQFENFGQDAIKAENLQGTMNAESAITTELSENFEIVPGTIKGDVKLKLKDGHLLNFEPLQNLSSLVFRKRDFKDIAFSELNESFHIDGFRMKIDELEVASTVLNFYVVDGLYNFRGVSNINVLLPWSNLKRRKKDDLPAGSGMSASDVKGVKLNFRGPKKAMKVSFGHQSSQGL